MIRRLLSLLVPTVILLSNLAAAQAFQASLWGRITSAQGGVPGVSVTALNMANGVSRRTATNKSGMYSFPAMDAGCYIVTATIAGYETYERDAVCLSTATPVSLDLPLEPGSSTTIINGHAPVVIATASTGLLIDDQMIDATPTARHNIYELRRLVPSIR